MEDDSFLTLKHLKLNNIPEKYKKEFKDEIYRENIRRQSIFAIVIFFMSSFLFFIAHTDFYYKGYNKEAFFIIYSVASAIMCIGHFSASFLKNKPSSPIGKTIEFLFPLSINLIGISIALADINISHQVNPYVISTITIGSVFYFKPLKILAALLISHSIFLIVLPLVAINKEFVDAFYINTTVMAVLSFTLSRAIYNLYLKSFMSRKIAEEKSEELQIAHEKILSSEKLSSIAKLAGGIAHELNSPLGAMLTSTQLLKLDIAEYENSKELMDNLNVIEDGIKKSTRIISKLLKYTNNLDNKNEDVNLSELLYQITRLHSKFCTDKNIECVLEADKSTIYGSNSELIQALNNIFTNCVEAFDDSIKEGSKKIFVKLYYNDSDNNTYITFEDNGIGIKTHLLTKVFDPFFTTKKIGTSMGLGLSLAYEIIKKHNGNISIDSTEGQYTKITVIFKHKSKDAV